MKNKIYIVAIISIVILNSCNDSILDIYPSDSYTEDIFWKTELQADAGYAACYQTLRSAGIYGGSATPLWEESLTPNATAYQAPYLQMSIGTHDASTSGIIRDRWKYSYEGIGRCNTLIDRIGSISMSESKKALMIAEAKFLRALYYSMLINYYGDVPLILESPKLEHKTLPRTNKDDVFTQIIKDLDEAATVLPIIATLPGKATKGAAYALKARQYLYNGNFTDAAATAKLVMDMGTYELFPNYRELFMPENENNKEVIFDVQFQYPNYGHSFDLICRQYNSNAPLRDLIDAYLMNDGSEIGESPAYDPDAYWANRDPRFSMTLVWPGSTYMGKIVTNTRFSITGYTIKKYSVYDEDNEYNDIILKDYESYINYIVLRYADILLMYAEAKMELNQIDQSVYDAVNLVRNRAGMPAIQSTNPMTPTYVAMGDQTKMREVIRLERRIEFAGEGFYYMDILRWKTAHIVNNGPIYNYNYTQLWIRMFNQSRDYLWPIPQYELDENPNLVPKNPGW